MRAFSNYHPFVLFFYFIGVLLVSMMTVHPVLLAISFLGAVLFASRIESFRAVAVSMGFYAPMFLLIAITNPLFSHNGVTPLFFMNDNPVTLEAMLYGLAIGGMIVSVAYWCRCYSSVVTSDKFIFLFGRFFPRLSLVLSMALRFIPLFMEQVKRISAAQKTLGLYTSESRVDRLRSVIRVFSSVITWSLENTVDTASSMRARGYGLRGRTSFSTFRFTVRDGVTLALLGVLFGTTFWGLHSTELAFSFYPRITAVAASPIAIGGYLVAAGMMSLPFLIEVKESMVWSYLRSRI